jgi:MFS family permease
MRALIEKQHFFLRIFFFLSGLCAITVISSIAAIKTSNGLNEAILGNILLASPVGSIMGIAVSSWMVSQKDSRMILAGSFILLSLGVLLLGYASNIATIILALWLSAFSFRIVNIAINTQLINISHKSGKNKQSSCYAFLSLGGIAGAVVATVREILAIPLFFHLFFIAIVCMICTLQFYRFLLIRNEKVKTGNSIILGKPDRHILFLGLIGFCVALCEGGIFTWSGIFFKEILYLDIHTFGYIILMSCIAGTRFISDKAIAMIGMANLFLLSGFFIIAGIATAIISPSIISSTFGFCLAGIGLASLLPMTIALAGRSKNYPPGKAISIVTSYTLLGAFIGPPLIGHIAHATSLRNAYILFLFAGLFLIGLSKLFFRNEKEQYKNESMEPALVTEVQAVS